MSRPQNQDDVIRWLRSRFRVEALREGQAEIVSGLLRGQRQIFVAPTGHGKSLCYQALAASPWTAGVVLVFQPLIALMDEQVRRARQMGLRAELLNSTQEPEVQERALAAATSGELDILFLAPERQGNPLWLKRVPEMVVKGAVIDEAHCISQWGHDFRPWYQRLVGTIVGLGLRTPVLAVTATAPLDVVRDIEGQMSPRDERIVVLRLPSHRPNIVCAALRVQGLAGRLGALLEVARGHSGEPGIGYTLTTDEAQMAAAFLSESGIPAQAYTGQMDADSRSAALQRWQESDAMVICATSALGMGMDRTDVRWVVHLGLPDSLIRYVQEIGRVGRDGKVAWAIGLHDPEVEPIYRWMVTSGWPDSADYEEIANTLVEGPHTRTELIEATDVPENTVQRILDDLRQAGLVLRQSQSPYVWSWVGKDVSPVPAGLEESRLVRQRLLERMLRYEKSRDCRSIVLARAMEDDVLPSACGQCDRCRAWTWPEFDGATSCARAFLGRYRPPLRIGKRHGRGVALSQYGLGEIGEAIKESKYRGRPVPESVLRTAVAVFKDPEGPYSEANLDAVCCLPSTSSGDYVPAFCRRLAAALNLPLVVLEKTRITQPQKQFRSRHHKRKNVKGAFRLPPNTLTAAEMLLVDDVWDSGESIREAARMLLPTKVFPLTLAKRKGRSG